MSPVIVQVGIVVNVGALAALPETQRTAKVTLYGIGTTRLRGHSLPCAYPGQGTSHLAGLAADSCCRRFRAAGDGGRGKSDTRVICIGATGASAQGGPAVTLRESLRGPRRQAP